MRQPHVTVLDIGLTTAELDQELHVIDSLGVRQYDLHSSLLILYVSTLESRIKVTGPGSENGGMTRDVFEDALVLLRRVLSISSADAAKCRGLFD
jgi:hypothetical protein